MTETLTQIPTRAKKEEVCDNRQECTLGLRDAMDVLSGKWKIQIIGALVFGGRQRFKNLQRKVEGIGAKMLSKELQDLERHQLITRTVIQSKPITVEYEITPYGRTLEPIFVGIGEWGIKHRRKIMKES